MQTSTMSQPKPMQHFPAFDLRRLMTTVFNPKKGEKLCLLIDLKNPQDVEGYAFLKNPGNQVQKKAYEVFYEGLKKGLIQEYGLTACDLYAYKTTGGSNLELPLTAISVDGREVYFEKDIYPVYDIILCISDFSATAPLTATAKKYRFRGSTMHGLNDIIVKTGLSVNYNEVSREAELLRSGLTGADSVAIEFEVEDKPYHLDIELEKQEAQKSHGICHVGPDIVNLPAGEVYFVPKNAFGSFPVKFEEDGTLGLMTVEKGAVTKVTLIRGDQKIIDAYQAKFTSDPASGILGELGFGTQILPHSGRDIQDEKIFGTFHLATGRNDHLNGTVTKERFVKLSNATHDDILFSRDKTPEIKVKLVRMKRNGKVINLIENYEPTVYLWNLRKA